MSITEIQKRAKDEARLHEIAIEVRKLLDEAKRLELSDSRDGEEAALALATEE